MLAIFNKSLVNPPEELHSPSSPFHSIKPKFPDEILVDFTSSCPNSLNPISMRFEDAALLAFYPPETGFSRYCKHQRFFCGFDDTYCMFIGSLNNLCSLNKQYGLSKGTREAMFVIEAYRTLRDRGPYPAYEVLKELDGNFGFVIYDAKSSNIFISLGTNDDAVRLFWGIAGDGSVIVSDKLEIIKGSCAKSYAPFPTGCMFHTEQGLMSFEHPMREMKPMRRIDSEGAVCGATFKVDAQSRISSIPRVGSEANWALGGS